MPATKVLVSGLINLETTLRVEAFPIEYSPVRYPFFGVSSTVSGVGYNVALALHTLGSKVALMSLVGTDPVGGIVKEALAACGLGAEYVLPSLEQTPQSVIIYDGEGRRQINVDLKDIQERAYPPELSERALAWCDVAVLANIGFSR